MWLIILGLTMLCAIAGLIYLTAAVRRFALPKKLTGKNKVLGTALAAAFILIPFLVINFTLGLMNAVVVLIHVMLFFALSAAVVHIYKRLCRREPKFFLQGWLALIVSVIYLGVAFFLCEHVWQTNYTLTTAKSISPLRVAMFADSHLGTTFDADGLEEYLKAIEAQSPDILLIPGDFVDDSSEREDIIRACEALGRMDLPYGVWFSFGNHDEGYYNSRDFSGDELREALISNGVHVLEDECVLIDNSFYVVGRLDSGYERMEIADLLSGLDTDRYIIVMDHEPNDYDNESLSAADLVLSGHTHGGQLFPITYVGVALGINDNTYGYERINDTDFIVTSGISDWALNFKTGTYSEYVIIDINGL